MQQLSHEQMALQEQAGRVAELESERATLREQLAELTTRVETMETLNDPNASLALTRLQLKTKELDSKLELEQTTRSRLEVNPFPWSLVDSTVSLLIPPATLLGNFQQVELTGSCC